MGSRVGEEQIDLSFVTGITGTGSPCPRLIIRSIRCRIHCIFGMSSGKLEIKLKRLPIAGPGAADKVAADSATACLRQIYE